MPSRRYMLDTNILSDLIKHPNGAVAGRIANIGESAICTSIVVACELRYGAIKKGSPVLSKKIDLLLSAIEIKALEEDADGEYGKTRSALEKMGTPIGANDTLIAAHAMSQGLILVSDNVGEFQRIEGLRLENWLQA